MQITLKIENDVIVDAKFKTFGCAAAIATSSTATQMVIGMTIEEALQLTNKKVVEENKAAVNAFLEEYAKSIEFIGDSANIETSAQYIVDAGIMAAVPAAKTALSNLKKGGYIAYLDGDDMRVALEKVYNAFGMNLIGGKIPDDGFYYEK